jgi:hypothetical protein
MNAATLQLKMGKIIERQKSARDYDIGTRDLLPRKVLELLPTLESTSRQADPHALLRLFDPATGSRWLVIAGSPEGDDYLLYCHVVLGDRVSPPAPMGTTCSAITGTRVRTPKRCTRS